MNMALRDEYLAAMNLETWVLRANPARVSPPAEAPSAVTEPGAAAPAVIAPPLGAPGVIGAAATASVAAKATLPAAIAAPGAQMPSGSEAAALREADCDWDQLRARVAVCARCALSATRRL